MPLVFYAFAGICALLSLWQLRGFANTRNQLMFFVFLSAAICLAGYQLLISGLFFRMPHLFLVMNLFALIAIASMYYYACWLTDNTFILTKKRIFLLLLLAAVYAALLIPFWYLRGHVKVLIIGEIVTQTVLYTRNDPLLFGVSVFKLSNGYFALVCLAAFALGFRVIFPQARRSQLDFYALLFYGVCFVTTAIGSLAAVINSLTLLVACGFFLGLAFAGLYLTGVKVRR